MQLHTYHREILHVSLKRFPFQIACHIRCTYAVSSRNVPSICAKSIATALGIERGIRYIHMDALRCHGYPYVAAVLSACENRAYTSSKQMVMEIDYYGPSDDVS